MIKRHIFLFLLFFNSVFILAQKTSLTKRCSEVSSYYDRIIPPLLNKNNIDEVLNLSEQWINECGEKEIHSRLQFITSLNSDSSFDSFIDERLIKNMLVYRAKKQGYTSGDTVFYLPYTFCMDIVSTPELDSITLQTTRNFIKSGTDPEKKLLSEFYANQNDSVFYDIQQPKYAGTSLQESYLSFANQTLYDSLILNIGLVTGIWTPMGASKVLGTHPVVGFQFGFKNRKNWNVNISMVGRLLESKNSVRLEFNDTLRSTKDFMGGYFGIDIGKDIKRNIKNEIRIIGGVGLDGLYFAAPVDSVYSKDFRNFNMNAGIVYRRNIKQQLYMELQARYNLVMNETKVNDVSLQNTTDLSGNSLSFRISIGFLSGGYVRNTKLRHLQYIY